MKLLERLLKHEKVDKKSNYDYQIAMFVDILSFLFEWKSSQPNEVPFGRIMITYDISNTGESCYLFLHIKLGFSDNFDGRYFLEAGESSYVNKFQNLGFELILNGFEGKFCLGKITDIDSKSLSNELYSVALSRYAKQMENMELSIVQL